MYRPILIISGVVMLSMSVAYGDDNMDTSLMIDGVDVTQLSDVNLKNFVQVQDEIFQGKLDMYLFKNSLREKKVRRKRRLFLTLGLLAGKYFLKKTVVKTLGTVGTKIVTAYNAYESVKDVGDAFNALKPKNVTRSGYGDYRILKGKLDDMKLTARYSGQSGKPTLEFEDDKSLRQFEFNNNSSSTYNSNLRSMATSCRLSYVSLPSTFLLAIFITFR